MEVNQMIAPDAATLRQQWQALRDDNPQLRIRNAAEQLGVSEMMLLLTEPESRVQRLQARFPTLYQDLPLLGRVMTLARNDEVVHETTGVMGKFSVTGNGNMGLCLGAIDLRVFFSHWRHGYAVTESGPRGERHSLQFFDAAGGALHKVYAVAETDMAAWQALVQRYRAEQQRPELVLEELPRLRRHVGPVDSEALRADWEAITDVHQFHDMLQKHKLDRLTALERIGTDWAFPVPAASLETVLHHAARTALPVMVFVGNRGIVQIYTGTVKKLVSIPRWFNVLDADFNLHVLQSGIHATWVVRRPSEDGVVTSLDGFNAHGELVFSVFGERKPGVPELAGWRALMAELEALA